ncbi:MAG: MutT/NUDIX family protein [uncultured bacterium]|nr:MAG: MutT/NUDIX family protein [uncultured bacterium]HCU71200.1 DNA mismatch repair protein MutT [Candidatus Moranbacteria bacterium]
MNSKLIPGKDYVGVGGGALIFNKKKEILLLKRAGKARNNIGWWAKPGGKVRFNEAVLRMIRREIKEETNIEIDVWGLLPHTDHIIKKEEHHWVAMNFIADYKKGELKIMEPHKCEKLGWFALDKLPKKIEQTTREAIKNYLAGKYIKLK